MAATWLRINEMSSSSANVVCIVARIQSINIVQRTLILYDDGDDNQTSSSSTLFVSLVNIRALTDAQSSALVTNQYVQVYGKVVRQGTQIVRIDAQFIRSLDFDFDMKEYIKGLILTRNYTANAENNSTEDVVDNFDY